MSSDSTGGLLQAHHVTVGGRDAPLRLLRVDAGSGPPLLLLHGMFGDHLDWEPAIEPLSRQFRVIVPDLPGFGDSDKPDASYDRDFFLDAIRALLDESRVEQITLVGNSFGGLLALLFALEYPQCVNALVLVGSGGLQPFDQATVERVNRVFTEQALLRLTAEAHNAMFSPVFVKDGPVRQRYIEKQNAKLSRSDFPAYARAIARTIQFVLRTSCEKRLAELRCPTLLLWGEQDTVMPPEIARAGAARIAGAQVQLLAGCGHAPQLECPEGFARAVIEFAGRRPDGS